MERRGCVQVLRKLWRSLKGSELSKTLLIVSSVGRLPDIPPVPQCVLFGLEGECRGGFRWVLLTMMVNFDRCLLVMIQPSALWGFEVLFLLTA